jgi:hypothetical protein
MSRRFKVRIHPRTLPPASASGMQGQHGTTQDIPCHSAPPSPLSTSPFTSLFEPSLPLRRL